MNDTTDSESAKSSRAFHVGRIITWIGIVSVIIGISSMFVISSLAGTGIILTNPNYQILNIIAVAGIILAIIGILVRYATTNFSEDGIWALKTGPYVK